MLNSESTRAMRQSRVKEEEEAKNKGKGSRTAVLGQRKR